MNIEIKFSIKPNSSNSSRLRFVCNDMKDPRGRIWISMAGKEKREPIYLNQQTTKIVQSLVTGLSVDPVPEYVVGCDDASYELEIVTGFNSARYQWWGALPSQWRSFESLVNFFEGFMLSQSEVP